MMVLLWAANFIVGKIALRDFEPLLLGGLRAALAALFILPIYARSGRGWSRQDVPVLVLLGVFGVALNQFFFVLGLSRTSVAHAAILMGLTPVFVLLLSGLAGHERLTWVKALGMSVALGGVSVLNVSPQKSAGNSLLGDAFIFLAALTFALFTVIGKRVSVRYGSITVNTFAYVGGALMLSPVTLWQAAGFSFHRVSAGGWASLIYMALFPSMVCYLIYYHALTQIPASRVSAFSYLQPLLATLMAVPALGETITGNLIGGGLLVLAGVWLTERA